MHPLLLALFQTVPLASIPPAPPAPSTTPDASRRSQRRARPPYVVEVEATANGKLLWQGSLRVGSGPATFQRTLTEAPPEGCQGLADWSYASGARESFRITLTSQEGGDGPHQSFNVQWQRPADDCSQGLVNRSLELSGSFRLQPGESAVVQGDGGLKLRLARR
jgi:hypothetical protein